MAGVISYGAYVPRMRLGPETKNWPHPTERAATNFDEDAVTMGVAAARECLNGFDRGEVDALYFASTSGPYAEKQSAAIVATAADLRRDVFTVDIAHSLRSGTQALRMALDGVKAGSFGKALVVVSDNRQAPPGSDLEGAGGDAAVALLIGDEDPLLEPEAWRSRPKDILDVWRADGDNLLSAEQDLHFRFNDGYFDSVTDAAGGMLDGVDLVAMYSPDARRRREMSGRLGLAGGQVVVLPADVGSSGAAFVFLQLAHALETATKGQRILLAGYGDGADCSVFRVTKDPAAAPTGRRSLSEQLARATPVEDYLDFLAWRGLGPFPDTGARIAPATHALYREQDEIIRFHGMKCGGCGMVQYPAQRVCVRCQVKDNAEPVAMSEGGATLFSYSLDHVAGTPDSPLLHGVVDFEVGGRAMMQVTERDISAVQIGMKLDLTFRKFSQVDGISNYLWKAVLAP